MPSLKKKLGPDGRARAASPKAPPIWPPTQCRHPGDGPLYAGEFAEELCALGCRVPPEGIERIESTFNPDDTLRPIHFRRQRSNLAL